MNINDILDHAYASAGREKSKQDELVTLREQNAALVAALELALSHIPYWIANNKNGEKQIDRDVLAIIRAALAKCKGAKP